MRDSLKRDVLKQLATVCTATEMQLSASSRDFRKQLVREDHYKALVRTACGMVFAGMAQILAGDREAAKALLKEIRDADAE